MSKIVFLDVDGTLVESEGVWDEVRRGLAAQDRVPWPDEATAAMIGPSRSANWPNELSPGPASPNQPRTSSVAYGPQYGETRLAASRSTSSPTGSNSRRPPPTPGNHSRSATCGTPWGTKSCRPCSR